MFGDILSDLAAMIPGSVGLLPSAALGDSVRGSMIQILFFFLIKEYWISHTLMGYRDLESSNPCMDLRLNTTERYTHNLHISIYIIYDAECENHSCVYKHFQHIADCRTQ